MHNYTVTRYITLENGYKKATWASRPMTIAGALGTVTEAAQHLLSEGWDLKIEENGFVALKGSDNRGFIYEITGG